MVSLHPFDQRQEVEGGYVRRIHQVCAAEQVRWPLLCAPPPGERLQQPCWEVASQDAPVARLDALTVPVAVAPNGVTSAGWLSREHSNASCKTRGATLMTLASDALARA